MAGFYYYLPGVTEDKARTGDRLNRSILTPVNLSTVLDDVHRVPEDVLLAPVRSGPDGKPGLVLYPLPSSGDLPPVLGFDTDSAVQRWTRIYDTLWIGWLVQHAPLPTDLERRTLIDGFSIPDAHGHRWHVPTLRAVDNPRGRLPASFNWSATRQPEIGVAQKYRELWRRSGDVWDLIESTPTADGPFSQAFTADQDLMLFQFVIDVLAVNYRVSNIELSVLDQLRPDWLDGKTARVMLDGSLDMFLYRRWLESEKKTGD